MTLKGRTQYPLSVDCVIFGYNEGKLLAALIERRNEPYKGLWAIPGGFLIGDETVEEAAARELKEETGISDLFLEQFHVYSNPDRDPRGRVITVAFYALVNADKYHLVATQDAARAEWFSAYEIPKLAFDHERIYKDALNSLRLAVRGKPLAFELLPQKFTLTMLQALYEQIFKIKIDKRNFRKKIAKLEFIKATKKITKGERNRPAQLYTFDKRKFQPFMLP